MDSLKLYRKRKGLSQAEVASYLGIAQNSYSRYESGSRQPDIETLQKLSAFYNISIDQLIEPVEEEIVARPIKIKPDLVSEDEVFLPVVASLRCGFSFAGEPYMVLKKVPVPKSYLSKWGKGIVGIEAVGKSMMPTIRPYDICICVPGEAWEDNQIVVVDINDSDTIKRIRRTKDGGIDLIPDNPDYEIVHYTREDLEQLQVHVLGRVAKVVGPDLL